MPLVLRIPLLSFTILLTTLHPGYSYAQQLFIDTTRQLETGGNILYIGFPKEYVTYATASADTLLKVEKISKTTFGALANDKVSSSITNDTTGVAFTKTSFTIQNQYFARTFERNILCDCLIFDYQGIITPLHLYAVVAMNMGAESAFMDLIDYRTGLSFPLPAFFNKEPQAIVLSPLSHYLLSFTNSTFEQGSCCINLLHVNENVNTTNFSLQPSMTIYFDRMNIQKLVWLNDRSFVMEVTENEKAVADENNDFWKKIKRFLKITLIK
jgi:hypothetical protein